MRWETGWRKRWREQSHWHTWYAWHPVGINGYTVWLATVRRRAPITYCLGEAYRDWEYREVNDGN